MWWLWPAVVTPIVVAFAVVYQDWLLPSRRRIGYEAMRRDIRELKNSGPPQE